MKALMLEKYEDLQVVEVPEPACGPDEVLIRVAACGICGSDVHGYDGGSGRRIPPIIMGHEAAGVIAQAGADVKDYRAGDRVTFDSTVYCGKCEFCKRGEVNLCDNRQVLGVSCGDYRRNGAFAELVAVPARILYRLPEDFPMEEAAMLEAVSVALHGVRVTEMKGDESALVIGAGMIGLLTAQAARAAGCKSVMIADVDEARLQMAAEVGIPETLHLSGQPLIDEVLKRTDGRGVDVVLEAVGPRGDGGRIHRVRASRRYRHAHRQHSAGGAVTASKSCHQRSPAAGLVLVRGRVHRGHSPAGERSHHGEAANLCRVFA